MCNDNFKEGTEEYKKILSVFLKKIKKFKHKFKRMYYLMEDSNKTLPQETGAYECKKCKAWFVVQPGKNNVLHNKVMEKCIKRKS